MDTKKSVKETAMLSLDLERYEDRLEGLTLIANLDKAAGLYNILTQEQRYWWEAITSLKGDGAPAETVDYAVTELLEDIVETLSKL